MSIESVAGLILHIYSFCTYVWMCTCVIVREQLVGLGCLLVFCGSQELNSGLQTWQQAPLSLLDVSIADFFFFSTVLFLFQIIPKVLVENMELTRTRWTKVLWALSIKAKQRSMSPRKVLPLSLP